MARPSLQGRLERDVYQIVKDLERSKLDVDQVYEIIKKSNSSLSRLKRKPLEDAIEKVIDFHRQDLSDSDSEAAIEVEEAKSTKPESRFLINRQLTKHWGTKSDDVAMTTAQSTDGKTTKRRRLSPEPSAVNGSKSPGGQAQPRSHTPVATTEPTNTSTTTTKKAQKPSKYVAEEIQPQSIILGGMDSDMDEIHEVLFTRIHEPECYRSEEGLPVGYLIYGPPGTGKQSVVKHLASVTYTPIVPLGRYLLETRSPEKATKIIGDVVEEAQKCAPCIILLDHLDRHTAKGASGHNEFEQTVSEQLIIALQRLQDWEQQGNKPVVLVATTSKLEMIDANLRTPKHLAETVMIKIPDANAREAIFRVLTRMMELPEDFDYKALAKRTHGFVGQDIVAVLQQAKMKARRRRHDMDYTRARMELPSTELTEELPPWEQLNMKYRLWHDYVNHESYTPSAEGRLTFSDISAAVDEHTPSLRREGFSAIPSTTWSEVGALQSIRTAFQLAIVRRIRQPELFAKIHSSRPSGVLLFGPPGCGKTLVAKAVANDAQASFILIKGPELLNKYVGESERAIRELFTRAKSCAPCILFFDEMDSLVPKRENTTTEAGARVVNALLAELDGAGDRGQVFVIGTSNRPDMIDPAILRPGRLDKLLFVDLPTEDERVDILRTIYVNGIGRSAAVGDVEMTNGDDTTTASADGSSGVDIIEQVARDPRCAGFSGADLFGLYMKAVDECIMRHVDGHPSLNEHDWEEALKKAKPSVSNPEMYRRLARTLHHQS